MRLVHWNINHRTREKRIPPALVDALAALEADLVVLTEYVHGPTRASFIDALSAAGLGHHVSSVLAPGEYLVLIAARAPLERGDIVAPPIAASVPSNALHVRSATLGVDVLGMRLPDYSRKPALRRACWDWILETANAARNRPFVILGDLNTDPAYPRARCGDRLGMLVERGWQHALPAEGDSYWGPGGAARRLDHAFVTPHFAVTAARYVTTVDGHQLGGRGPLALSDHAALLIDIDASQTL
jgi:endonuclease/exonuclease/phosphatase family metal-dependent hydrolase